MSLDWNDNTEQDLDGYNVYRGTNCGGGYTKLHTLVLLTSAWTDSTVTNDTTYFYVVKAVDDAEQESEASAEVGAIPHASCPDNDEWVCATTLVDEEYGFNGDLTSFSWSAMPCGFTCGKQSGDVDFWFKFTPGSSQSVSIVGDTTFAVYYEQNSALTQIGCSTYYDHEYTYNFTSGSYTYYIRAYAPIEGGGGVTVSW